MQLGTNYDAYQGTRSYKVCDEYPTFSYWSDLERSTSCSTPLYIPQNTLIAKDKWSSHFMALVGTIEDAEVIMVTVYAPTERRAREAFYKTLATIHILLPTISM